MTPDDRNLAAEWEQLDQLLAGELGASDRVAQGSLPQPAPDALSLLSDPATLILSDSISETPESIAAAWDAMERRIAEDRSSRAPTRTAPHTPHVTRRWTGLVVATALAATAVVWYGTQPADPAQSIVTAENYYHYATDIGQRARIILPDGSSATLAPETRMRVPETFGQHARSVELDGEAVFTVVRGHDTPFLVRAGSSEARVLGTTFSVRKYPTDNAARLAVAEGRVAFGNDAILSAGEVGTTQAKGDVVVRRVSDIASYFSWTDGRIQFRYTPLNEVLQELSRWYQLDIRIGAGLSASEQILMTLENASESDMLQTLSLSLDARVVRQGRLITLLPK